MIERKCRELQRDLDYGMWLVEKGGIFQSSSSCTSCTLKVVQVQDGKAGQGGVAKFLPSSRKPSGHPASGCITPFQILADQIEIKLETDNHLDLKDHETKL